MGFAVIPNIYSIAEDAVFSVPKSLTFGSLALGATPWQTLTRVVILTASPGIFSALMIGLGRAVGETMIVLMATGNTPIMDTNIFQGLQARWPPTWRWRCRNPRWAAPTTACCSSPRWCC